MTNVAEQTLSATDSYLLSEGLSVWAKGGQRRIYLGHMSEALLGLHVSRYGSGNISSATLDGEKISNREAGEMVRDLIGAYWDIDRQVIVNIDNNYVADMSAELSRRVGAL